MSDLDAKPGEVERSRTLYSTTFEKPDGSRRLVISKTPIHYQSGGELVKVDCSPVSEDGRVFSSASTPYLVRWDSQTAHLRYESKRGGVVEVRLVALGGVRFDGSFQAEAVVAGRRIRRFVAPGVEIHLVLKPRGVEIFKWLHDDKAPKSLTWEVTEQIDSPLPVNLMNTQGKDNALYSAKREGEFLRFRPIEMQHAMGKETVNDDGTKTYRVTETFTGRTRVVDGRTRARSWVDEAVYPVEIDVTVNEATGTDADDGFARASGYWYVNYISTTDGKAAAVRFQTVDVPQGATINSATLGFNVTFRSGTATVPIKGQDVDDAPSWANLSLNSPESMTATTASVNYAFPATTGAKTVDVTSIIQEIVDRPGWTNNNDIRLGVTDNSSVPGGAYMYWEDYNAAGTAQPTLVIDYTAGGASGQPTMRRFGGVPGMTPGPQSFGRGW